MAKTVLRQKVLDRARELKAKNDVSPEKVTKKDVAWLCTWLQGALLALEHAEGKKRDAGKK